MSDPDEPQQVPPGPSQVTPGPSQVTPGPSQVTPGPSQVPPGPSQVPPGASQVPPGASGLPPAPSGASTGPRRGFLKLLTGGLAAAVGAVAALPGLGFLAHPLRRPTVSSPGEPLRVAAAGDVKAGEPLRADVVGDRLDGWLRLANVRLGACWLVRGDDGGVRAFSTVCPHLGCGVEWSPADKRFGCPCHASSFAVDGRRLSGPSPRDLDELDVTLRGDDVVVRYRRFKLSTPGKEPLG